MRRTKRRLNLKKLILFLLILMIIIYLIFHYGQIALEHFANDENYDIVKADTNTNYDGIGQETIQRKDGYFTTFTTTDNYKKTYIEYKQNGEASWSNNTYWGNTMAENGCRNYCNFYYLKWLW